MICCEQDMSWSNPSKNEAEEEYYNSKRNYQNASYNYNRLSNTENAERQNFQNLKNQYQACSNQKLNFQKRIKDLDEIIAAMERSGFLSLPNSINNANNAVKGADEAYKSCIKCTGIQAADIIGAFSLATVEGDNDSNSALNDFKKEKQRLENSVKDIERNMQNIYSQAESTASRIRNICDQKSSYRRIMRSSAYTMNHYKRYM